MSAPRRAFSCLREEQGIALVLAIVMLTFFSLLLTTLIHYTTSNTSATSRQRADQQAFALAEAGLSDAMSRLGYDPSKPDAVPGTSTAATLAGATYTGSLSGNRWTLTGVGSVRNPSHGTPITRRVTQQVEVYYVAPTRIWNYLFSDATTGCMTVKNNKNGGGIAARLYVRGNLCLENNAWVVPPRDLTGFPPVQVQGTTTIANNGSIGLSNAPIMQANLVGGCNTTHDCTSADNVFADSITRVIVEPLTKPAVDLAYWYQNASPGPNHPCTSGSVPGGFVNAAAFDLTPGTAYSCSTAAGQISWTPGNPGMLTVSGVIFFDRDIVMNNNANAVYTGKATIYSSGSIVLNNGAKLCAIAACNQTWNTAQNILMFVAGEPSPSTGFHLVQNSVYQGAAYTVGDYHLENNARNWGPVVANQIHIDNNSGQTIPITELPPGAPGTNAYIRVVAGSYSG